MLDSSVQLATMNFVSGGVTVYHPGQFAVRQVVRPKGEILSPKYKNEVITVHSCVSDKQN
jgi:hypothetical protein